MDERIRMVAAGYDRVADSYERLEEGAEWPRLRRVRELLALVPAGGAVLDLGCGNGVPVLREIAAGFVAVGVDVSREQVRRARENVPEATVLHRDMSELELEEQSFDAIVSCYSIEHVPRERHEHVFERIHAWLKPGGRSCSLLKRAKRSTPSARGSTPRCTSACCPRTRCSSCSSVSD